MERLIGALEQIRNCEVFVIGDSILDIFSCCEIERISREAPVNVVTEVNRELSLGGAANVARNIAGLGGEVKFISVIGNDAEGKNLIQLLKNHGIDPSDLIVDNSRPTPKKTRICNMEGVQLICHQIEKTHHIDDLITGMILSKIKNCANAVVVISDYHRGIVTEKLVQEILATKNTVIADIRPRQQFQTDCYKGAYLLTPNREEAKLLTGRVEPLNGNESVAEAGLEMVNHYSSNVLITRDGEGMSLITREGETTHFPIIPIKEVMCVSGAGDTVIGTIALSLSAGIDLKNAANISRYAASVVVEKPGTASLTIEELRNKVRQVSQIPV